MRELTLLVLVAMTACQRPAARGSVDATPTGATATETAPTADPTATLDDRRPVPLAPMMAVHMKAQMRDHLSAVQAVVHALAADDLAGAATAADRLGSSPTTTMMCEHMGADAPGFTDLALGFHTTADRIGAAARRGDRAGALKALDDTLATCVGCHATFRQEIVGAP